MMHHRAKLEESKEMRKFRRRQGGISAEGLLVGEKVEKKEGPDVSLISNMLYVSIFMSNCIYKLKLVIFLL